MKDTLNLCPKGLQTSPYCRQEEIIFRGSNHQKASAFIGNGHKQIQNSPDRRIKTNGTQLAVKKTATFASNQRFLVQHEKIHNHEGLKHERNKQDVQIWGEIFTKIGLKWLKCVQH